MEIQAKGEDMLCLGCNHSIPPNSFHNNLKDCINYLNGLLEKVSFQQHYKSEYELKIKNLEERIDGLNCSLEIRTQEILDRLRVTEKLKDDIKAKDLTIYSILQNKKTLEERINELEKEADSLNEEIIRNK
jgi:uncharacterized protein Yka (UPF0111/DUF47 family)